MCPRSNKILFIGRIWAGQCPYAHRSFRYAIQYKITLWLYLGGKGALLSDAIKRGCRDYAFLRLSWGIQGIGNS